MCLNISKVHTRIFSKRKKSGKMLIMRLVANLPIGKHSNNNNNNNNNINAIPIERNHYICIPAIDIDSVLKSDKRAYPQAYL